jgi:hypothetical protein
LIDSVAKKLAGEFFAKFAEVVVVPPQPAGVTPSGASAAVAPGLPAAGERRGHALRGWIVGAVIVAGLALYLAGRYMH